MKNTIKTFAAILSVLLLCSISPLVHGQADSMDYDAAAWRIYESVGKSEELYCRLGEHTSDWYTLGFSQGGMLRSPDIALSMLDEYIDDNEELELIDRLRISMLYLSLGEQNLFVLETASLDLSNSGIMEQAFSVILCDDLGGEFSEKADLLCEDIVDRQKENGGWSLLFSQSADVDITSMMLTSLSSRKEKYSDEIELALEYLSRVQKADGGFASYGVENCESCAQVIIALCSLGISTNDERFVKNGNTVTSALQKYLCEDGKYSHTAGGVSSDMASYQALIAYVALCRSRSGASHFYSLGDGFKIEPYESYKAEDARSPLGISVSIAVKLVLLSAVILIAVLAIIVIFKKYGFRKGGYLYVAITLIIAFALGGMIAYLKIETPEEYYSRLENYSGERINVTVEINAENALGKSDASLPDDGRILRDFSLEIPKGETAYHALAEACRQNKISLDGMGGYVRGISGLYERDIGSLSGWQYSVNGEFSSISSSELVLSEGDRVVFIYTCNMGEDIK